MKCKSLGHISKWHKLKADFWNTQFQQLLIGFCYTILNNYCLIKWETLIITLYLFLNIYWAIFWLSTHISFTLYHTMAFFCLYQHKTINFTYFISLISSLISIFLNFNLLCLCGDLWWLRQRSLKKHFWLLLPCSFIIQVGRNKSMLFLYGPSSLGKSKSIPNP